MINLRVFNQSGRDLYDLDLKENEHISLSYEFANVQDISKSNSSFSKTFRLPPSENNFNFFGMVFNVNISDGYFDPNVKARCFIFDDSLPVFEGSLRMTDVIVEAGNNVEIEIQILGEVSSLYRELNTKELKDITFSTYNHNTTLTNIKDGLEATGTFYQDDIAYTLQDWGSNLQGYGDDEPNDIYGQPRYIWDIKPLINAYHVFEAIIHEAGYTFEDVSGSTTYADIQSIWMLLHREGATPTYDFDKEFYCIVGLTSNFSFSTTDSSFVVIPFDDESTGDFHDDYNLFASNEYTFPYVYNVTTPETDFNRSYKAQIKLNITSGSSYSNVQIKIGTQAHFFPMASGTNDYQFYYESPTVSDTDSIDVQIRIIGGGSFTINAVQTTRFNMWDGVGTPSSLALSVSDNMPKATCLDFLKDFINRMNLVIVPSKLDDKHLIIDSYNDYIDAGEVKDWTNKLDISKAYRLTPTTSIQSRELEFTSKEGKDILNALVKDEADRIYGRKRILNYENEFSTGQMVIKLPSVSTPVNAIHGTGILVPKLYTADLKIVAGDMRFFYECTTETVQTYQIQDSTGTTADVTKWRPFMQYSEVFPNIDDLDICFGAESPFHQLTAKPLNTMYKRYWERYILELYNSNSRLFSGYFALSSVDINQFRFNDKIFIKDSFYRVNKISNFNPSVEESVKVELIKLDTDFTNVYCNLTPYSWTIGGQVLFTDGTSNNLVGTERCCEYFDYTWNGSTCRWNLGTPPPSPPRSGTVSEDVTLLGEKAEGSSKHELTLGAGSNKQASIRQYEVDFDFSTVGIEDITDILVPEDTCLMLRITYLVGVRISSVLELASYTYDLMVWNKGGTLGHDTGFTSTKTLQGYSTHEYRLSVTSGLKLQINDTNTSLTNSGRVTMRIDATEQKTTV